MRSLKDLLVVIPHSGIRIPAEIPSSSLSEEFPALLVNVDWHTDRLYDFTDLLENQQLVFPYCSLLLEANRDPELLDESIPLRDVNGKAVYRPGCEPSLDLRRHLSYKYLHAFHQRISASISAGAEFLLDGHSTVVARGVAANQIDLMNFQHTERDGEPKLYAPAIYAETYAEALQKRLPGVNVTVNASEYYTVHGHVCAAHSVNGIGRAGQLAPALIQETSQGLYMHPDGTPDVLAVDHLRRVFAEALRTTLETVRRFAEPAQIIDLHGQRQTFDFDCGVKALQMVLAYYGVEEREDKLLKALAADPELGTPLAKMIEFAESRGFEVKAGTGWSLDDVKHYLDRNCPVIVLVQAWADGYLSLAEWRRNFDDGHYVVVVGYDRQNLYFEDPASFHRTWLKENEFLARWHDQDPVTGEKLLQAGMVLLGREPVGKGLRPMH